MLCMIRKVFKKKSSNKKLDAIIKKYKIPPEFLSTNRRSVSRALAVGIFVAVIPMPMQMLAIIFLLPIFRFNAPIGLATVWLSNPITMPFMYYIEYLTGNFLLGCDGTSDIELSLEWFENNLDDIFIPLYAGTLFYAIILSFLAYYIVNHLWIYSVKKEKSKKGL